MINLNNNDYQISKKDQKLLRQFEKQVHTMIERAKRRIQEQKAKCLGKN